MKNYAVYFTLEEMKLLHKLVTKQRKETGYTDALDKVDNKLILRILDAKQEEGGIHG